MSRYPAEEVAQLHFREGKIWWGPDWEKISDVRPDGKSREFTRPIIILEKCNQYSFLALPLTTAPKPNPYRLPIGIVNGRQAFAMLSQTASGSSKKGIDLDADILAAIKKEASSVNFG